MKPIETRYAGHRFRSRLEARWAVFLDHLGVVWEYEPQGYLVDGRGYLPDFRLTSLPYPTPMLFEVKGVDVEPDYAAMLASLSGQGVHVLVSVGQIPRPDRVDKFGPADGELLALFCGNKSAPEGLWWTICPTCNTVGVETEARSGHIPCGCPGHGPGREGFNGNDPRILAALTAARSARFEHGESGAPSAAPTATQPDVTTLLEHLFGSPGRRAEPRLCGMTDPQDGLVACSRPPDHYGRHMGVSRHGETHVWDQ